MLLAKMGVGSVFSLHGNYKISGGGEGRGGVHFFKSNVTKTPLVRLAKKIPSYQGLVGKSIKKIRRWEGGGGCIS